MYRNVLKLWISNVKICIDKEFVLMNEGESNRKFPIMFTDKYLRMTQEKLHALI